MTNRPSVSKSFQSSGNPTAKAVSTKRIDWIDKLKAFAFFLVIVGHFDIPSGLKLWLYSFHMPLFLFITGMTFNIEKTCQTGFLSFFKKQAKRILVPYFWLQMFSIAIGYAKNLLITGKDTPVDKYLIGIFCSNANLVPSASLPSYYAVLLFFVLMGLWAAIKITSANKGPLFALLVSLSLVSILTERVHLPCHLNVVPTGMLLVLIGRLLMNCYTKHREKIHSLSKGVYLAICLTLFIAGYFLSAYNGRISLFKNFYGNEYIYFVICSIITSVAFVMLVLLIPPSKLFSFIGQNTFFMLCLHYPLILVAEAIVTKKYITNPIFIAVGSVLCLALLTIAVKICNQLCPYLCGMPPKAETLPYKLCKFAVVAVALSSPCLFILQNMANRPSIKIIIPVFILLVFAIERILTSFMPFMFCSEKK